MDAKITIAVFTGGNRVEGTTEKRRQDQTHRRRGMVRGSPSNALEPDQENSQMVGSESSSVEELEGLTGEQTGSANRRGQELGKSRPAGGKSLVQPDLQYGKAQSKEEVALTGGSLGKLDSKALETTKGEEEGRLEKRGEETLSPEKAGKEDTAGKGTEPEKKGVAKAFCKGEDEILLMTLNVRGLNDDPKVKALQQLLYDLKIDVAIIAETHLNKKRTKALKIPGYTIEAQDCREDAAYGGVFIAVKETAHFSKVGNVIGVEKPANACTLFLHPGRTEESRIRITGVYLPPPPTAQITPKWVEPLACPGNQSYSASGELISHPLVGDFNQRSWKG